MNDTSSTEDLEKLFAVRNKQLESTPTGLNDAVVSDTVLSTDDVASSSSQATGDFPDSSQDSPQGHDTPKTADKIAIKQADIDDVFAAHNPNNSLPLRSTVVTHKVDMHDAQGVETDAEHRAKRATLGRRIWLYTMIACAVIIVLALGRLAFAAIFPDRGPDLDATTTLVKRQDLSVEVKLDVDISKPVSEKVIAPSGGALSQVMVDNDAEVTEGQQIAVISYRDSAATNKRVADARRAAEAEADDDDDDDKDIVVEVQPVYRNVSVVAPADGKITWEVNLRSSVTSGMELASIEGDVQIASGTLTPDQKSLIGDLPNSASIDISDSEQTCRDLALLDGSDLDFECRLPFTDKPLTVTSAPMTIAGQNVKGVLAVPVTAVERIGDFGTVYVLDDPTDPESGKIVNVKLGVDNGKMVEVYEGLKEGDRVVTKNPDIVETDDQSDKDDNSTTSTKSTPDSAPVDDADDQSDTSTDNKQQSDTSIPNKEK